MVRPLPRRSALDAIEAAVTSMEDDDTFDAGRGSFLTSDATVQLDALSWMAPPSAPAASAASNACATPCRPRASSSIAALTSISSAPAPKNFVHRLGTPLIDNRELVLDRERERLREAKQRAAAGLQGRHLLRR